ncbi:MAG: bifunctional phosphoglucose/phosphomannose isomerase [Bellilinea sp.]
MNLDDATWFATVDKSNMLAEIDGLPDQLETAWNLGSQFELTPFPDVTRVLVAGMGGSAIGADLLATYLEPISQVPIFVQRDYTLPAWAFGKQTLVIASSHSGNTEETLSVFERARQSGCQILVISTGGRLAEIAHHAGVPVWKFNHSGQPRAAVGFSFGLLLNLFSRQGWIPAQDAEMADALEAMRAQQASLRVDVPTVKNPAKRQAGQMMGRWVVILGSGLLAPVARRWKGQVNELAKAWGQFDTLPEADHNTLAGIEYPEEMLTNTIVIFLRSASDHPRNLQRSELTRQSFMVAGLGTDYYVAQGNSRLAQMWTAIHFGDYTGYYLAMAYGVDPTPIPAITSLKNAMQS